MIGRMFCYGSSKLGNFNFFLVIALDTGKEDFALPGFEAVDQRWNRTLVVHVAEKDEFLVKLLTKIREPQQLRQYMRTPSSVAEHYSYLKSEGIA